MTRGLTTGTRSLWAPLSLLPTKPSRAREALGLPGSAMFSTQDPPLAARNPFGLTEHQREQPRAGSGAEPRRSQLVPWLRC